MANKVAIDTPAKPARPDDLPELRRRAIAAGTVKPRHNRKSPEEEVAAKFPQENIEPRLLRVLNLPFERAEMLATLPRSRLGDLFWPAITGVCGAAPGAARDLYEAFFEIPQKGLMPYATLEVCALIVFLVLLAVSLISRVRSQTSLEYLNTHYPPESRPPPKEFSFQIWRLKWSLVGKIKVPGNNLDIG
jgi:hypothetical protein